MRIYAALAVDRHLGTILSEQAYPNVLLSFAFKDLLDTLAPLPPHLMLDSGAFSAWSTGKQVNIRDYARWAKAQQGRTEVASINLDVIPGVPGRMGTDTERRECMRQSLKNADWLRGSGVEVMEVYHQGEPASFLHTLLDRLPEGGILGLSTRKRDTSMKQKLAWQDMVLAQLLTRYPRTGLPKCHGLGVFSIRCLQSFPYYSVDSSTWAHSQMFGEFIGRDGVKQKVAGNMLPASLRKTGQGKPAVIYAVRRSLENQLLVQQDMTTLWANRGVRFE